MITPRIDVAAGTLQFAQRCYRATRTNTRLDPLPLVAGEVRVNLNDAVKSEFAAELSEPTDFLAYRDYLAPWLTLRWRDAASGVWQEVDEQVGLFVVIPPSRKHTALRGARRIQGYDLLWLLASQSFPNGYVLPAGANLVDAVRALLVGAGIGRYVLPASPKTGGRTWRGRRARASSRSPMASSPPAGTTPSGPTAGG